VFSNPRQPHVRIDVRISRKLKSNKQTQDLITQKQLIMCTIIGKKGMLRFHKHLKMARPIGVKAGCLVITNTCGWRSLFNGACNFCLSWEKNSWLSDKNSSPKPTIEPLLNIYILFGTWIWKSNFCIKKFCLLWQKLHAEQRVEGWGGR
jgi:hypothetical protein